MRIAFYAPLKSPDHDVPSGDRRMARAIMGALELAGHDVDVASHHRAWSRGSEDQAKIEVEGRREAKRLIAHYRENPPDVWFTYHLYYRAPDWIGPVVAAHFGIPYVVAEASFAMKRAAGPWAPGHDAVEGALRQAKLVYAMKDGDIPGLAKVSGFSAEIVALPPFLEFGMKPVGKSTANAGGKKAMGASVPVLLAVGMMRSRAKLESYRFLAAALETIKDLDWTLIIAGDGQARSEVEAAFAGIAPARVHFAGAIEPEDIGDLYGRADLFVWPGLGEAYGMVYLEAQSAGLPVVATASAGVHNVVVDGVSGRLVGAGDPEDYGRIIADLLQNPDQRHSLGATAAQFVREERSLAAAAAIIDAALARIVIS